MPPKQLKEEELDLSDTRVFPTVAVVILNWNGQAFLEKFLPSVVASKYFKKRVIVADNASTDNSIEFLKRSYPGIEIIHNPANEGYARGYNLALQQIESDYYVLLNSDIKVEAGWIEPVIKLMESDERIAACQPKILSYDNDKMFEYAGASGGWIDNFGYPFTRGRVFDTIEDDHGQYNSAVNCFWASGAALFVKAKAYHEMGGLDEYFFAHQEEIDLCWRLQLSGYKIFVEPASIVYHVGGGTLPKGNNLKTFLNFRNNLVMLYKNLPAGDAVWKIPFRIFLDAVSAWKNLLSGDPGYFSAIIKAHFSFFKWIFFGKNKRKVILNQKHPLMGWYGGLIVWDYFIKKQKTFYQIMNKK